jgi:hypothetical protein
VLLADDQGFYLACNGYAHEVAEEISALSAEISMVHARRTGLLINLCKLFGSCLLYTYVLSQFNQCIAIRYFQRLCTYYTNSGNKLFIFDITNT